ncbi:Protein-serine/threonine phosphatase [Alteripontixanthobacter maritimus]|uniref:Protein-serine/threonine phosphatase n=1 Tax=Alteripontixanthobacter maritimus TaxID=2161824 RepID=A0A369Q2Y2_9SPHN|nr:metallophosphoesterase family protein [Alteripontixanthobacter maritimus]RDC59251.1 Protein-serine/threonine phosphatase [Alteripontixanthobacter maritimus]
MLDTIRSFFSRAEPAPLPAMPAGERAYVIGDIHGCLDLFDALIGAIEADDREQTPAETTFILLGDLVDRGPDSAGVVARARQWQQDRNVRILAGNHEEMFLDGFENKETLRHFLKHGGRETVLSYGIDRKDYNKLSMGELQKRMDALVPVQDRDFLRSFEDFVQLGDYLFVHAGIAPGKKLTEQRRQDMLWIREPFLRYAAPHDHMVVHGHTIFEDVDEQPNRIGIDTGAFRFGRLTALVLEGTERRYIQAAQRDGSVVIEKARTLASTTA